MLILPFAEYVYQFNTRQHRLRPPERFETQHRPCPSFDITVILFNQVIEIFTLADLYRLLL
jgi:hypothetical protein